MTNNWVGSNDVSDESFPGRRGRDVQSKKMGGGFGGEKIVERKRKNWVFTPCLRTSKERYLPLPSLSDLSIISFSYLHVFSKREGDRKDYEQPLLRARSNSLSMISMIWYFFIFDEIHPFPCWKFPNYMLFIRLIIESIGYISIDVSAKWNTGLDAANAHRHAQFKTSLKLKKKSFFKQNSLLFFFSLPSPFSFAYPVLLHFPSPSLTGGVAPGCRLMSLQRRLRNASPRFLSSLIHVSSGHTSAFPQLHLSLFETFSTRFHPHSFFFYTIDFVFLFDNFFSNSTNSRPVCCSVSHLFVSNGLCDGSEASPLLILPTR